MLESIATVQLRRHSVLSSEKEEENERGHRLQFDTILSESSLWSRMVLDDLKTRKRQIERKQSPSAVFLDGPLVSKVIAQD